ARPRPREARRREDHEHPDLLRRRRDARAGGNRDTQQVRVSQRGEAPAGPGRLGKGPIPGGQGKLDTAYSCDSIVSAPLTSYLPGPSTLSCFTTPFSTSIE